MPDKIAITFDEKNKPTTKGGTFYVTINGEKTSKRYRWCIYKKGNGNPFINEIKEDKKPLEPMKFGSFGKDGGTFIIKIYDAEKVKGKENSELSNFSEEASLEIEIKKEEEKVTTRHNIEPKILEVHLMKEGEGSITKVSYQDTLIAFAKTQGLQGKKIHFHLWENDKQENDSKHSYSTKEFSAEVEADNIARLRIPLITHQKTLQYLANRYLPQGANGEGTEHEFCVTASFGILEKHSNEVQVKREIQKAYFVDKDKNKITKIEVGDVIQVCIESTGMIGAAIKYTIWEKDGKTKKERMEEDDPVYQSGLFYLWEDQYYCNKITVDKEFFERGKYLWEGDSESQNYSIEVHTFRDSKKSKPFELVYEDVEVKYGNSPVKVSVVEVHEEGEEDIESMHNDRYFLPVISIKEIYQIETFKDFTPFSIKSDEKAEEVKLGFWNKIPTNDNLIYAKEPNVSIIFDIHNIGTLKEGYIFPIITDSPHIENELDNKNQHIRDFPSSFDIPFSKEQFFNIKKETNIGISATIIESEKWQPTSFTNGFKIGKDTTGFDLRIHFKERINKDFYLDIFTSEKEIGTVKLHKIKIKLKITTCFEDCSQCFDYQDVVENPQLNNQSDNVNKNRFKREKRYNNKYPQGYFHTGTDILAPLNTPIYALLCGEVIEAKDTKGDLGKIVIIKSKDKKNRDIWIQYCHLNDYIVTKGQKVRHGENIGLSGNTGNAKDIKPQYYHVHIEASTSRIFYGGNTRIDPEQFMKTKFDDTKQGNIISR